MEYLDKKSDYTVNKDAFGNVRIWDLGTKAKLLDQPNLITNQGASIAAKALSGAPFTSISHIYVGYNNTGTVPSVNVTDTIASFGTHARIPLSFAPSFSNETGYSSNLVYFTVYVTGSSPIADGKQIVELGLVNATSTNPSDDLLFSHIAFSPVIYQATYGIAITWGLTFRAS